MQRSNFRKSRFNTKVLPPLFKKMPYKGIFLPVNNGFCFQNGSTLLDTLFVETVVVFAYQGGHVHDVSYRLTAFDKDWTLDLKNNK